MSRKNHSDTIVVVSAGQTASKFIQHDNSLHEYHHSKTIDPLTIYAYLKLIIMNNNNTLL